MNAAASSQIPRMILRGCSASRAMLLPLRCHGTDMVGEFRVLSYHALECGFVERVEIAVSDRPDGGGSWLMQQKRHFSEEVPVTQCRQNRPPALPHHLNLPVADEVHLGWHPDFRDRLATLLESKGGVV